MARKLNVVCDVCGSEDIVADANAHWDKESQSWEVGEVWEKGAFCNGCDCMDARYDYKEIIDGADDTTQGADDSGRKGHVDTHDQLGSIRDRKHKVR